MTDLAQLVEVGARALYECGYPNLRYAEADERNRRFWGDHARAALLAILPLLADDLAGLLEAEKHCGCGRSDCVADNTAQNHADTIRTRIAAIIEGEG